MNVSAGPSFALLLLAVAAMGLGCGPPDDGDSAETPFGFTAVTFNTGTTEGLPHDALPGDGYGDEQAALSDAWYGDGLAWTAVVEHAQEWFAETPADVVGFQEIFYSGDCDDIPDDAQSGFVCEDWQAGDPTVAQTILGDGWQVACHVGKSDKCLAVRRSFGSFEDCDGDLCLEGLAGAQVPGCGGGSRVGRGIVELVGGGTITVVNVHGTSGLGADDKACRLAQFEQVFVDLGDGSAEPAANGERNLVLGDFNTDPGRFLGTDSSAAWLAKTVEGSDFRFHTGVGPDAEPTYAGFANIDHVISDAFIGDCWAPSSESGHSEVSDIRYFDHKPSVCDLGGR
jgi:hypothetical protein